jgi:hypothetical protein
LLQASTFSQTTREHGGTVIFDIVMTVLTGLRNCPLQVHTCHSNVPALAPVLTSSLAEGLAASGLALSPS